jgi:peptidoglycan lytic transglycosylase A
MIGALRSLMLAGAVMATPATGAETTREIVAFSDLDGWEKDDHGAALAVFLNTCQDMNEPDWRNLCALAKAQDPENARAFFELFFRPVVIRDHQPAMFTGYFEPELDGARRPGGPYRYPVYKMPPEARSARQWLSRNDILNSGVMTGRGLEIAWVDDPVELFFLQIQGSGRIRLPGGGSIRVGYGGSNGRNYRSIGVELVRRGIYKANQVSAEVIKNWVRRNPEAGAQLLLHNPSYVFFREVRNVADQYGPLGAMNRSITALRSIAVDPMFTPLGAPVWLEKDGAGKMRRLMIAQDTGSAIKGAQRGDVYFGTGKAAGLAAGRLRDPGRMVVFLPIQRAYAMMSDEAG